MGSSSSSSMDMNMTSVMMVPYLHFTGGDYLIFKSLSPTTTGQLAGASIVLFFFALIERGLAAFRSYLEAYWERRTQALSSRDGTQIETSSNTHFLLKSSPYTGAKSTYRTFPSFTPSHDIPRGIFHAFQAFIGYGLMLAVMTFQAAYIIAILIGLGVGEVIFGRFSAGRHSGH